MTTLEILRTARDKIRNPENWQQGEYRNGSGTKFCALGAVGIRHFTFQSGSHIAAVALDRIAKGVTGMPMHEFNDSHTHAEVLELFNLAIAAELAKEQEACPISDTSTSSRPSLVPA